jgi:N-carbamoyl-L-amino-acid hydrolase
MSPPIREVIHDAAAEIDVPAIDLHSGAGHDAGVFAARGVPSGMLFVRSLNGGASHRPDELTDPADIGTAISVLTGTLTRLARAGQRGPETTVTSPSASA